MELLESLKISLFRKRQRLVGGPLERNSWSTGIITIDDRLIHYFLAYVIIPKHSNFSTINDCEMQILYVMKNTIQVKWAYAILNHWAIYNKFAHGLPYAHWLTFKKNNLNLIGEKVLQIVLPDNEITLNRVCNAKNGVKYDPHA